MYEDIIHSPQTKDEDKAVERRHKSSNVPHRYNLNQQKPAKSKQPMWSGDQVKSKSLTEQIKLITDLRQLVKILEIAKIKVRREKQKQRKKRKDKRQIKY